MNNNFFVVSRVLVFDVQKKNMTKFKKTFLTPDLLNTLTSTLTGITAVVLSKS